MSITAKELPPPDVQAVRITDTALAFDLIDGRSITVPLAFYPTLLLATKEEREDFEIAGPTVYWPRLDCDLPSDALLDGAKEAPHYSRQAHERAERRKQSDTAA